MKVIKKTKVPAPDRNLRSVSVPVSVSVSATKT